jgi:hypothetical protein
MGWAAHFIAKLKEGVVAQFRPRGIVPVYPFGVGHVPLTVPFIAVDACEIRSRLFVKHTVVTLRNGGGTIGIAGAAGTALRARLADAPTTSVP